MRKYQDMYEMLEKDMRARQFFEELPAYVRNHISTRAGNVNSYESLRSYAENLLSGDI
ncbi:MAG TPA: hypothetical protein GXZ52_01930 [Clostridiales bacterium]|nr:hypothetical protein [Clostridiales bacterium]